MFRLLEVLALVLSLRGSGGTSDCVGNAIYNSHINKCIQFFSTAANWLDAERTCEKLDGRLVSIASTYEGNFINGKNVEYVYTVN